MPDASQTAAGLLPGSEAKLASRGPASTSRNPGSPLRDPWSEGSLTRSAQLGPHPQSPSETPPPAFLATVPAHAYLLPILQVCSLESLQPLLHKCWMFIHSWGSFDSTGWGPGPCNGLKGKGQGDVLAHAIVGSTGQVPLRSQDGSAN